MMKAGDLKNALMQLNNDDMVVFNFELLDDDGNVLDTSDGLGIHQVEIVKSYEDGNVDENNLERQLNINLYHYVDTDIIKKKK